MGIPPKQSQTDLIRETANTLAKPLVKALGNNGMINQNQILEVITDHLNLRTKHANLTEKLEYTKAHPEMVRYPQGFVPCRVPVDLEETEVVRSLRHAAETANTLASKPYLQNLELQLQTIAGEAELPKFRPKLCGAIVGSYSDGNYLRLVQVSVSSWIEGQKSQLEGFYHNRLDYFRSWSTKKNKKMTGTQGVDLTDTPMVSVDDVNQPIQQLIDSAVAVALKKNRAPKAGSKKGPSPSRPLAGTSKKAKPSSAAQKVRKVQKKPKSKSR